MSFKTILSIAIAAIAAVVLGFAQPAFAANINQGQQLFTQNCNMCHQGGVNRVIPDKNLSKAALEKYGKYSTAAIESQITNGAGAMPAFKGRLQPPQIKDIAAYVYSKAESGW